MNTSFFDAIDTLAARLDADLLRPRRAPLPAGYAIAEVGGARIRYRAHGGFDGPTLVIATDPPVVLEQYDALVRALGPRRRVVVFELPGFGFSTAPPDFDFAPSSVQAVVAAFVARVAEPGSVLVFPCAAAFAALAVARAWPDLVAGLVLPQAPSWDDALAWKAQRDPDGLLARPVVGQLAVRAMRRRRAGDWFQLAAGDRGRAASLAAMADRAFAAGAGFSLASIYQRFLTADAGRPPRVDQPTLVVWGDLDRSHAHTDPGHARSLGVDVEVIRFADAGHFPELEAPVQFAAAVDRLIARL